MMQGKIPEGLTPDFLISDLPAETPGVHRELSPIKEVGGGMNDFRKGLGGWRTSPDGEDYCPDCWGKYMSKIEENYRQMIKKDSHPTSKYVYYRRALEGWCAQCEDCHQMVTASYTEAEAKEAKRLREEAREKARKRGV